MDLHAIAHRRAPAAAVLALLMLGVMATAAAAHGGGRDLDRSAKRDVDRARAATARFHDVGKASRAGYAEFKDAEGIACIDNPGVGAMGIHYVNGELVEDPAVKVRRPEALVYDPGRNGQLRLVALEYIVFQSAWDAEHDDPPRLFGREFHLVESPNRYGLPPFYELHLWAFKRNPRGLFDDWNPRVSC
jgi:hypothetical protein